MQCIGVINNLSALRRVVELYGKYYRIGIVLLEPNMSVSQMMVCSLMVIALSEAVPSFCPYGCDCRHRDDGRMYLQCEKSNLKTFTITNKTYTDIDSILLGENYLKSFNGTEVSSFYPNLSMLDLKENHLSKVENDTFRGFVQLEILEISYNNITEIDSSGFSDLRKLKTLHLRHNKINIVKNIWFKHLKEVSLIDLRHNLIQTFEPPYFRWPSNLRMLLLQSNSFHVLPPLPRNPESVNISDNTIDCSCQRLGQEKVDKDVLLRVTVTCNEMSSEKWRKMHWENPFCKFPTVRVEYKEFDDIYIVKCTGDGFPLPKLFFKHQGQVVATSLENSQVIYGIINDTNITCEARSPVGNIESHLMGIDEQEEGDSPISVKCSNTSDNTQEDITSCKCYVLSLGYYTTMFISCVVTISALVVSLYIFNISFRQLKNPDNEP